MLWFTEIFFIFASVNPNAGYQKHIININFFTYEKINFPARCGDVCDFHVFV